MTRKANALSLTLSILICLAVNAYGQAPETITYQGRLTDLTGDPIVLSQSVVFSIYDVPTGGEPMWAETLSVAPDAEGVFTVELGTLTPLTSNLFDGAKRYLGLQVGLDSEMSPRQWLTSTPYAISAGTVPDTSIATEKLADGAVVTTKLADGAVTSEKVLDASLDAVDLLDEAGLTFLMSLPPNTFRAIPAGRTTLDSIEITVPDAGYVYVFAHVNIGVDHVNGTQDHMLFQVSNVPDTVIPNNFGAAMIALPPELPTQGVSMRYVYPISLHRPFQVTEAGTVKYFFNAWIIEGASAGDAFFNLQLTAMYFPTAYGAINLSPPLPDSTAVGNEGTDSEEEPSD